MKIRRDEACPDRWNILRTVALSLSAAWLVGCGGRIPSILEMMPAPAVVAGGEGSLENPGSLAKESLAPLDILYATNRARASEDDEESFYTNERGYLVRVGSSHIAFGDSDITWEEAQRISLLKNRADSFPLKVGETVEYGVVPDSISSFTPFEELESIDGAGSTRFLAAVEERLARSKSKDIIVYVHGYKVEFENPLLVASEMWHFLGYEGAVIAFSWPSTPARLAYFKDVETARVSAWGLRKLIAYLARETSAERVHIVGYSAGTRVVLTALYELALIHQNSTEQEILDATRLGQVVLVGSDVDTGTFASFVLDGLLRVQEDLNLYVSPSDKALRASEMVLRHRRLGEVRPGTLDDRMQRFVSSTDRLHFVDVADADNFDEGNGHAYFRKSPWVSSDVLMTVRYGLMPADRGLVRADDSPIWRFPPDYVERFEEALSRANPDFPTPTAVAPSPTAADGGS